MEELARIRSSLQAEGKRVFDFGTGDPKIPVWENIRNEIQKSIPEISQYPSIKGSKPLVDSIWNYLGHRFSLSDNETLSILPTNGSKEAIFHMGLSIVGRKDRKTIAYPSPGYPVYKSSTVFAGGIPYPVELTEANGYLMEPWNFPEEVKNDLAAIWINYPHNPTGTLAPESYLRQLIEWCQENDTLLLSDECYVDIYNESAEGESSLSKPLSVAQLASENFISFLSLSKRSGLTGFRSGFMIGPKDLMQLISKARANFGVSTPGHIQAGAVIAWNDEGHVAERRKIFSERISQAFAPLKDLGLIDEEPQAGFYLWCRVPAPYDGDDLKFCFALAEKGVITSPSSWLGENCKGYVRFALVPDKADILESMEIVKSTVNK